MRKRRLALFNNHSGYTEFCESGEMIRPNVSYCVEQNELHYNEEEMVFTLNLNQTSGSSLRLNIYLGPSGIQNLSDWSGCKEIRYDGVPIDGASVQVTAGEHVVEYVFPNITTCPIFYGQSQTLGNLTTSFIIPEGITRIEGDRVIIYIGGIGLNNGLISIPNTLQYVGVGTICNGTGSFTAEDVALLDSCCPIAPSQAKPHPWKGDCGK